MQVTGDYINKLKVFHIYVYCTRLWIIKIVEKKVVFMKALISVSSLVIELGSYFYISGFLIIYLHIYYACLSGIHSNP